MFSYQNNPLYALSINNHNNQPKDHNPKKENQHTTPPANNILPRDNTPSQNQTNEQNNISQLRTPPQPKTPTLKDQPIKQINQTSLATTMELVSALENTYRIIDDFMDNIRPQKELGFATQQYPDIKITPLLKQLVDIEDMLTEISLTGEHTITINNETIDLFSFIKEAAKNISRFITYASEINQQGNIQETSVEQFFETIYMLKKEIRNLQLQLENTLSLLLLELEEKYWPQADKMIKENPAELKTVTKLFPITKANAMAVKEHSSFEHNFFPLFEEFIKFLANIKTNLNLNLDENKIGFKHNDNNQQKKEQNSIDADKIIKTFKQFARKFGKLERYPSNFTLLGTAKKRTISDIVMLCNELTILYTRKESYFTPNNNQQNKIQAAIKMVMREASSIARTPKVAYEHLMFSLTSVASLLNYYNRENSQNNQENSQNNNKNAA